MFNYDILAMVAGIPGLIIAMVVHEYSHARAAVAMGDDTPKQAGRLRILTLSALSCFLSPDSAGPSRL